MSPRGTGRVRHLAAGARGELPCAAGLSRSHGEGWVSPEPSVPVLPGCWVVPLLAVATAMTEDVHQSECCILGAEVRLLPAAWWRPGTPCPGCLAPQALSLSWPGSEMSPGCALLHGDLRGRSLGER